MTARSQRQQSPFPPSSTSSSSKPAAQDPQLALLQRGLAEMSAGNSTDENEGNSDDDDDDDDDDFGSDKMLADLAALLPGRGKGAPSALRKQVNADTSSAASSNGSSNGDASTSNGPSASKLTPPSRSTSSVTSSSRSTSRLNPSRGAVEFDQPQPSTRSGSMTPKSIRNKNLVVPPRLAVSPSSGSAPSVWPAKSPLPFDAQLRASSPSIDTPTSAEIERSMNEDTTLYALLALPIAGPFDDAAQFPSSPQPDAAFRPGGRRLSGFTVTDDSPMIDVADGMIMDFMVQEAMSSTADFRVLPSEAYDARKKDLRVATAHIRSLQKRLALETKIREAAVSLAKFDSGDKAQMASAKEQLAQAERKVEAIAISLWRAVQRMMDAERSVFKHMTGVLRWNVKNLREASNAQAEQPRKGSESVAELRARLESAENKIKEQQRENSILQSSVSRLTMEQEPLRKLAEKAKKEARMTREFRDKAPSGRRGSDERLRLDLATAQADVQNLAEDLEESRDKIAKLQLQLDENVTVMEEKDSTIADLLAEVEEMTNQADMKAAAAAVETKSGARGTNDDGKSSRTSVWYREQVTKQVTTHSEKMREVLGTQLKEALLERERLKLQLNEQFEITKELQTQVRELRDQKWMSSDSVRRNEDDSDTEDENFRGQNQRPQRQGAGGVSSRDAPAKLAAQEALIADLRRQITKTAEAMAISEQDSSSLRRLYDELSRSKSGVQNGSSSFSVASLIDHVQILLKDHADVKGDVQNLQRQVARMTVLQDELENVRGDASRQAKESGATETALQNAQAERDRVQSAHDKLEQEIASLKAAASAAARDLADRSEAHEDQIADLTARYENKIKLAVREADEKEELVIELQDEVRLLSDMRQKLEAANRDLSSQLETVSQQSVRSVGKQAEELRKTHAAELGAMRDQLSEARDQLTGAQRESVRLQQKLEEATDHYEDRMRALQGQHDRDAEDLRLIHEEEMSNLDRQLQSAKKELARMEPAAKQGEEARLAAEAAAAAAAESAEAAVRAARDDYNKRLAEEQQSYSEKVAEIQAQLQSLSKRLEVSEGTLVTSKQQFFSAREQLMEQIDQAMHDKTQLELSLAQTSQELMELEQKHAEVSKEAEEALNRAVDAEEEANVVTADLERLRTAVAQRDDELRTLHAQLSERSTQLSEALAIQAEIAQIQEALVEKDSALAAAKKDAADARKQLTAQKAEFEQGRDMLETMQNMLMEMKKGKAGMLDEIEDCKYNEEMMRRKLDVVERDKEELSRALQALRNTNSSLSNTVAQLEVEISSLNAKLQDKAIERLGGSGNGGDSTTASMRAEFRKLVNDLRLEHSVEIQKQVDLRRDAERELRRMRREGSEPNINPTA
ncbi:hypothetical protein HDU89_007517 [Geranomyces variabilis]|nr:hypothetical protein HDU89_007517 [Geranomyces variabilis]